MRWIKVKNYQEMSELGAEKIFQELKAASIAGRRFNLGLATGVTMLSLYKLLAAKINGAKLDLSNLHCWNLDEYVGSDGKTLAKEHQLSYQKYMAENFFDRLDSGLNFTAAQIHFPDAENPAAFDELLKNSGNLDFQLLGIGFNGHIAFNEPQPELDVESFAALPTRVIDLAEMTIETNRKLTAGGEDLVPRQAVSMGMAQILSARKHLLLACFAEQEAPLKVIRKEQVSSSLPASFLHLCPEVEIVYTENWGVENFLGPKVPRSQGPKVSQTGQTGQ